MNDNHVFDLVPEYALGSLDADEARQVADHLTGCFACRQELEAYQQVADGLLLAVPEAMPSAKLRTRLAQRVRGPELKQAGSQPALEDHAGYPSAGPLGQSGGRSTTAPVAVPAPRRLSFAGAFAGLALILLLAVSNIYLWQRLNHPEYMTGPLGMKAVALQNTEAAPGGSAFAIVSGDGKNGVLVVDHLPGLDANHEYQAWLERGGDITAAGTFAVDEYGYRGMRLNAPDSLLSYTSMFVTVEPKGGSTAPTGAKVLNGSLFNK